MILVFIKSIKEKQLNIALTLKRITLSRWKFQRVFLTAQLNANKNPP